MKKYTQPVLGDYIGGRFVRPEDPQGEWVSRSPADLKDELGKFTYSYKAVDQAIETAQTAFKVWKKSNLAERIQCLKAFQSAVKKHEKEFSEVIAREVGKPLWETKIEVQSMINKVDVTINESLRLVEDVEIQDILPGTVGKTRHKPLGVMVVIGPFNFPGHLPTGHIVPALLTGNTIVFKPSEKAPMVGQMMAQFFDEAGFPEGVFNLIQGEKEIGRRLCVHEGCDAVLFTGSYEVGTRIKQDTLQQHWKLLALEMGGKNPAIVWKDAQLDVAIFETLFGAFVTAGQRCSATSRILVHESLFNEFVEKFHQRAKAFSIGHPLDNPFMGSLIDHTSVDRYLKFLGIAAREGAEILMRGKPLELNPAGYYVTPSICVQRELTQDQLKKSVYHQTEFFSPNVCIVQVRDFEETLHLANGTQYGLVCSVFTQSQSLYAQFWEELQFGLVNWNKSTVGASSRLPFGGLKKSGNHFPAAHYATRYCTVPIASLEVSRPEVKPESTPGLNWNS